MVGDAVSGRNIAKVEVVAVSGTREVQDPDDFFGTKEVSAVDDEIAALVKEGSLVKSSDGLKVLFPGTYVPLVVHNAKEGNFASRVVNKQGPVNFIIECATMAKGRGYKWVEGGFLKVDGRAEGPNFFSPKTEVEFFEFLNMPWTEYSERQYGSSWPSNGLKRSERIAEGELRQWIKESRWIDTKCGGEPHQFTARAAQKDDELFCYVLRNIYKFGYDGTYKGRAWRYLDFEGLRYFANNFKVTETELINRKPFWPGHKAKAWNDTPTYVHLVSARD